MNDVEAIGIIGRKMSIGKHRASNHVHLRAVIARLDAAGDAEAADTICWLVWLRELDAIRSPSTRVALGWRWRGLGHWGRLFCGPHVGGETDEDI